MELNKKDIKAIELLQEMNKNCQKAMNKEYKRNDKKAREKSEAIDTIIDLIYKLKSENYILTRKLNHSVSKQKLIEEINTLKKKKAEFIFIGGNTECIYYKNLESNIALLERILYEF